jgi:hypothetical protein
MTGSEGSILISMVGAAVCALVAVSMQLIKIGKTLDRIATRLDQLDLRPNDSSMPR